MSDVMVTPDRENAPTEYQVGFGRPPLHTRFQKGRSGNPKGRPVGSKSLGTLLTAALNEQVAVNENGKRRKISKRDAVIRQLVNKSASADLKAMQMLITLMLQLEGNASLEEQSEILGESDVQVMERFKQRLAAGGKTHDA
jgi:hypothetical protein